MGRYDDVGVGDCVECGKPDKLNGHGRCGECQALFDDTSATLRGEDITLDELVGKLDVADDTDDLLDVLVGARPPTDKLEQQRWREALLRALRGKVSSPAKIVDTWLGSAANEPALAVKQSAELVQLVVEQHHATLFHTPDRRAYAAVDVDGHREVMQLRSRTFRQWLAGVYWEHTNTTPSTDPDTGIAGMLAAAIGPEARVPGAQAIVDAIAGLEGLAMFRGPQLDVHVRIAHFGRAVYLDLGNDKWEAVEIDENGWRIVAPPPVMFRRPDGLEALPYPVDGGTIDELRPFLNVRDDQWPLIVGFVAALLSHGPYPVLVPIGEQGCGKSTAARVIRRLIDPNSAELRGYPQNVQDLAIAANNSWVLSFDNLSSIPIWLSDALCRIATGGGFATRLLYSDDEERIFHSMRPTIVNGIGDVVARSDLLDRSVLINLPVIRDVTPEAQFWADFDAALPRLLGAVLDAVSMAIANVGTVELEQTPRMADFARWVTAAEPALGLDDGEFLRAYLANRATADQTALEASPIGRFILRIAEYEQQWEGSATELLAKLNDLANEQDRIYERDKIGPTRRQQGWPGAANVLSNKLTLLAPNLRRVGVDVVIDRDKTGSRIKIHRSAL
jgi:hypothetical protein